MSAVSGTSYGSFNSYVSESNGAISFEPKKDSLLLSYGHRFHALCLKTIKNCPLCKAEFTQKNLPAIKGVHKAEHLSIPIDSSTERNTATDNPGCLESCKGWVIKHHRVSFVCGMVYLVCLGMGGAIGFVSLIVTAASNASNQS